MIRARIIKLQKEEEKANKRIKQMQHRNKFVNDMHQAKQDKMNMIHNLYADQKMTEDLNR